MGEKLTQITAEIMKQRFGKDSFIALATVSDGRPYVRAVNSYYENGSFYVITYALSGKMKHIADNPQVSICGDWFTAGGVGENMGYVLSDENKELTAKLRQVFGEWYGNGHINEADPNTCILRIRLTDGVLFADGTRYDIDFTDQAQYIFEEII